MKKLIVLALCVFLTGIWNVNGQAKSKKEEVPSAAKSAFEAKFPKAQKVKWGVEKPGEYEAEFMLNGVETSAVYDSKGQFIESEVEMKEANLPQTVKTAVAKDFASYKISSVAMTTDGKGVISYEMVAAKGREKLEISFDTTGKLLKKEAEKEEK